MTNTTNSIEIAEEFKARVDAWLANNPSTSNWNTLRKNLVEWFGTLNETVRFEAAMLVMKSSVYQHQYLMGDVLNESRTRLVIDATEFVRQLAPTFNFSADTIVSFLREQVGRQHAIDVCRAVLADASDERTKQATSTFLYFLGVPP